MIGNRVISNKSLIVFFFFFVRNCFLVLYYIALNRMRIEKKYAEFSIFDFSFKSFCWRRQPSSNRIGIIFAFSSHKCYPFVIATASQKCKLVAYHSSLMHVLWFVSGSLQQLHNTFYSSTDSPIFSPFIFSMIRSPKYSQHYHW